MEKVRGDTHVLSARDLVTDLDNQFFNSELLTTMDPPQVQVPGSEQINTPSHSQLNPNPLNTSNSTDVDMNGTQQTTEIDIAPEVITLPDSQPDPLKKKNTDKFLE